MTLHYTDDRATIYHGDCIEVMRTLPDNSVDSVVTDPPYGLEFMGKEWDAPWKSGKVEWASEGTDKSHPFRDGSARIEYGIGGKASIGFQDWFTVVATEALRVLKPGGHLLAFFGTRTWHRLAVAIEDAGFEVRDSIAWMYGSGFPKSHDVSKGIDKAAGAQRKDIYADNARNMDNEVFGKGLGVALIERRPATPAAQQWQGWGTALKPAHEPIVVARKPLIGTVAANVLTHGTGALNIDGCRIGTELRHNPSASNSDREKWRMNTGECSGRDSAGRWPANVILDESQAAALDAQSGVTSSPTRVTRGPDRNPSSFSLRTEAEVADCYGDSGGASRFFYIAKASSSERPREDGIAHPTVKPLRLMEYLCRLVTPPGGTILEPFAGSGTTIEAALNEGFNVIGIEMTDEYLPLIIERIQRHGEKLW